MSTLLDLPVGPVWFPNTDEVLAGPDRDRVLPGMRVMEEPIDPHKPGAGTVASIEDGEERFAPEVVVAWDDGDMDSYTATLAGQHGPLVARDLRVLPDRAATFDAWAYEGARQARLRMRLATIGRDHACLRLKGQR